MPPAQISVLGECVADAFVEDSRSGADALSLRVLPGGGPANTAVALARLGTPARFLGRLSADVFGDLFRGSLSASGVDLTGCVAADEPSTLAVAKLDGQGKATYSFHAEGTADWQWQERELTPERLAGSACLHTGSLALVREPGADRVEEFLARAAERATVSVDPNVRTMLVSPEQYRTRLERWCRYADILRLSDDDLEALQPDLDVERACDRWHAAGVPLVLVTLGARGAVASLEGKRVTVPAPPVETVDTVGAGDAFTAGLLHWLNLDGALGGRPEALTPEAVRGATEFATRVAAATCSVAGANPPWAADLGPDARLPQGG